MEHGNLLPCLGFLKLQPSAAAAWEWTWWHFWWHSVRPAELLVRMAP
jgi:hypothetical protein